MVHVYDMHYCVPHSGPAKIMKQKSNFMHVISDCILLMIAYQSHSLEQCCNGTKVIGAYMQLSWSDFD